MEKIDWDKAPEGYPVWIQGIDKHFASGWYRELSDRYINEYGRYYLKSDAQVFTVHERPSLVWNGEGLPPVGLRCEAAIPHTSGPDSERSFIWIEGSVIAYYEIKGKTYAWFAEDDGFYPPNVLEFRPIRTPEQIAADEREAVVTYMQCIIGGIFDKESIASPHEISEKLYEAGLRLIK